MINVYIYINSFEKGVVLYKLILFYIGEKSILRRTELFWNRSNPEGRDELSWDEYRARQYGFLTGIMN